ncbi:MAG: hypothetical protein ACRDQH_04450 [Pseudonocardiaceae bacterium]
MSPVIRVEFHLAGLTAVAVEADGSLAHPTGDVVEIEVDGFGDAAVGAEWRRFRAVRTSGETTETE